MSQVMEHARQLAGVIGPRPAATDAEASAADYIEGVFQSRGLEVERQEFTCPRTYSRAHMLLSALAVAAAVISIWLPWPALVLAVIAAVLVWLELDTRFSIAPYLGSGPSQNIIARHLPRQRRGERLKRVVIIAHYDSAKSSLFFSPGAVKNLPVFVTLMKWSPVAVIVGIMFSVLPFAAQWKPWTGYATCALAAYMLVPLFGNLHRELFGRPTDGANDNASGVAAMLGVMEATVPENAEALSHQPRRRGPEAAYEAGVAPDDAVLEYRSLEVSAPAPAPAEVLEDFGDVEWETGRLSPVSTPSASAPEPTPATLGRGEAVALWDDEDDEGEAPATAGWSVPRGAARRQAPSPVPVSWEAKSPRAEDEEIAEGQERLALDDEHQEAADTDERSGHGISAWLGIGRGFDVRKAGKKIGSWDNIETGEDDEFGFKAGTAGDLPADDEDETSDIAARIRRRVTEGVDRALVEKEIWFIATGSDEAGLWGTRALLDAYADDLKDALILNVDSVGAGTVTVLTDEGLGRSYHADRRLIAQAKRTAREGDLTVKSRSFRGLATSATPALARGFKAMTVSAFDINGRIPNWHWRTDTTDNLVEDTLEQATSFVTALVRDL